jgi:hypothetical protein
MIKKILEKIKIDYETIQIICNMLNKPNKQKDIYMMFLILDLLFDNK